MLSASVFHGRKGYTLHVAEVPLWAFVVSDGYARLCTRLHHRLCDFAWRPAWRVGQTMLGLGSRREQRRWTTALTDDEVRRCFPEAVLDLDD